MAIRTRTVGVWYYTRMFLFPQILAVITGIHDLDRVVRENRLERIPFAVTGTVSTVEDRHFYILKDGEDYCQFWYPGVKLNPGDRVFAQGYTELPPFGWCHADVTSIKSLGKEPQPPRTKIHSGQLSDETMRLHNVSIESVIMDVVKDAIAPQYSMLILRDRYGVFYASVKTSTNIDKHLIGASATISGVVRWSVGGKRKFNIPHITVADEADIKIVAPTGRWLDP